MSLSGYDACKIWQGARTLNGYGQKWDRSEKRLKLIHRWIWEQFNGPIPAGLFVCHRCDVRGCYRLDHLFLGTPADNTADMVAKGRSNRLRDRCRKNHDLGVVGIYTQKNGKTTCRQCAHERMARYRGRLASAA